MIIKKSHFKLNNPTLEENLLPYQKKKKIFINCHAFSVSCSVSLRNFTHFTEMQYSINSFQSE